MPCNLMSVRRDPVPHPEMAGPYDLARTLMAYRRTIAEPHRSNVSEERVGDLIATAFYASLLKDEGKYPLFRLVVAALDEIPDGLSLSFPNRQRLDVDALRRLGGAFNPDTHAFVVNVEDGGLWCHGVVSVDRPLSTLPVDEPAFWRRLFHAPGLLLVADGPGEVRVSEGGLTLQLKGGKISELIPMRKAEAFRDWLVGTAGVLSRRVRDVRAPETALGDPPPQDIERMLSDLMSRITEDVVYQRHGGAIAILPESGWHPHVRFNYPASGVHIGQLAVEYWEAFLEGQRNASPVPVRLAHLKRDEILMSCRSLARLANIDGCVGLSRELELWGFGGEILVGDEEALRSPRVFWDVAGDRAWPDQTGSDLGGTRHRSAFRLCKVVAHCLVVVVSEDGDLTLMASDEERVHCITGLSPVRDSAS